MERLQFDHPETLARDAAAFILDQAERAVRARGAFHLCLSGGRTPRAVYERLAETTLADPARWRDIVGATWFYWGDERCVPPDHPDSNYGTAWSALLSRIDPPAEHVRRMEGETAPDEAAKRYEAGLRSIFVRPGKPPAMFDLLLLGLGPDGHTASLFPGSPALAETERWVVPVPAPAGVSPPVARLTLTFPVLNASRTALYLVTGREKQPVLRAIFNDPEAAGQIYPAARIRAGRVIWMIDRAAWPEDIDEVSA